jgi:sugar transferase (PEP-CTERM/EpsH1 system associated)
MASAYGTADATGAGHREARGRAPPRTLRVVHVMNYMARSGGMEKGVATLVRRASPDIEHVVITIAGARDVETMLPAGTRLINMAKPEGHSMRFIWRLAGVLRKLSPCVVHTRNWPGLDGIVAARLAGIRAVLHSEHGWGVADAQGTNRRRILVRRFLSRWTRSFLCVSKDIERWLTKTVRVRCPVVQIYNGVEIAPFEGGRTAADLKAELGLPSDALLVGIVGRLDAIKDHPTLFRAFAAVRERFPRAELLCVGEGAEEEALRKLAGPGIHMLGERHDVPRILRGLDVFALTSLNEGISNTILEAMAAGLPVVASRVGGNPELVEDGVTGTLFPAGDTAALAEAITSYLSAPERRAAHGAAARALVIGRFRTEGMVRSYESAWRACAAHFPS